MILYFSGTGNSLYIARKLGELLQDRVISIAELICKNEYMLELRDGEDLGFVYPVIAAAAPDVVTDFVKKAEFKGYNGNYVYSVLNSAGSPEYTSRSFRAKCKKAGILVSGFYEVLMPGNYITRKKHLPEEKVKQYLAECDQRIEEITVQIQKKKFNYKKEKHSFFQTYILHKLAVLEKQEPFIAGDNCVGCGKCVKICPMEAMKIPEGQKKPERDVKQCAFCLACVNVCPTRALEVKNKTAGHPQYMNPHYNGDVRGRLIK